MNVRKGEKIEDWKIIDKLEDKEHLVIAVVINEKEQNLHKTHKTHKKWIMKLKNEYYYEEITAIKKYLLDCENAVNIPKDVIWHGEDHCRSMRWYVMELYDGDISKNCLFVKDNLNKLLQDVLSFLKHIHMQGAVHGDIKSKNILYRKNPVKFCVNDYEFLRKPEKNVPDPYVYVDYYYSFLGIPHGCSKFSYKADLVSFGYILWNILISSSNNEINFIWQNTAINYYNKKESCDYFNELDSTRTDNNIEMPDIIKYYFSILEELDWNLVNPPSEELYDKLRLCISAF